MNNQWLMTIRHGLLVTLMLALSACGGGGGDSGPPPIDTDNDGIADINDPDDDNDGTPDTADAFPLDPTETADFDGDGIGDNADTDDDNDGVDDTADAFPFDPDESEDSDADGVGDNGDAFPNDPNETADFDQDGVGDNADTDDDNDGVDDAMDAFPFDASESVDTDGDRIGNNADTDDDNDTVADSMDAFPLDPSESSDNDADGIGDNADDDDDNDSVADADDPFPFNPARTQDIQPLFPRVNSEFQLPNTPAANQLQWFVDQLAAADTSLTDINSRFDPSALAAISDTEWRAFIASLRNAMPGGTVQDIITMTPVSVRVLVGIDGNPTSGHFVTLQSRYGTGLITSLGASRFNLDGSSVRVEDQNLTFEEATNKLETLAEDVSVLVARIDDTNQCDAIFERRSDTPRGIASVFKIFVMGAVAQAIEDGVLTPDQTIPLTTENQVLGGVINAEPVGTEFDVRDMSTLMLGISDNTATEHLFKLVGRDRNEAIIDQFGFSSREAILPFLSMNEAFHLYFTVPEMDALNYIVETEAGQRAYVTDVLNPLGPVVNFARANVSALVRALWQSTPNDVCAAFAGLRQFPDNSEGFEVLDTALGAETLGVNVRDQWERVWFKGGSLSDNLGLRVLTYAWMFETDARGAYAVIVFTNNDSGASARIDQSLVGSVALRIAEIVDATN